MDGNKQAWLDVPSVVQEAHHTIENALLAWAGVTTHAHRFGGVEFRLGKVELGHLHGDHLADMPFPTKIRDELVREGRAQPHHVLPNSGWVSRVIRDLDDVEDVISLFRMNYDRLTKRRTAPAAPSDRR